MNIFLDSNVFWKDPFLTRGKKAILLRLAKHDDVVIYINETVYQEVLKGHELFLEKEIHSMKEAYQRIKIYLNPNRDTFEHNIDKENLLADYHSFFRGLEGENQLQVIPYDTDIIPYLFEVDKMEKAPFIKKEEFEDKKGVKRQIIHKEIRDAMIWYSYRMFIEKSQLEDCYFITNNTTDFGDAGARSTPIATPFPLHPGIRDDVSITAYKTIGDFLAHNDEKVKELFRDEELHFRVLLEDLYGSIKEEMENGLTADLVRIHLQEQIEEQTRSYLSDFQPEDIHMDYFMGGYILPADCHISEVSLRELELYGDTFTVTADVEVEVEVEVYLYNPVHDDWEDKFSYEATDTVKIEETIVFLLSIDTEKTLDTEQFSFRDYIENGIPDHLNIEFHTYENIHHVSLFGEDEEYEPPEQEE